MQGRHKGRSHTSGYCLQVKTGCSSKVIKRLEALGYEAFTPTTIRAVVHDGKRREQKRHLMPGYVFLTAPRTIQPDWDQIIAIPDVLRILRYTDGTAAFRGKDLEFLEWMRSNSLNREGEVRGGLKPSLALREGNRVHIVDGPLKDWEGSIVKVNRKRNCVALSLGEGSCMKTIWCQVEFLETVEVRNDEESRDYLEKL